MKLSDPLTDEEIETIKQALDRGCLGLYRHGEGEELYHAASLLGKMVWEYERLRSAKARKNAHRKSMQEANQRADRRIEHLKSLMATHSAGAPHDGSEK